MYSAGVPSRASDAGPEARKGGLRMEYCIDCDCRIPEKRLAAVPDAEYCVVCQPEHERPVILGNLTLAVMGEIDANEVLQHQR